MKKKKNKLQNLMMGVAVVSLPLIATVLLGLFVHLVSGVTLLNSLFITLVIEGLLGVGIYLWVKKEIQQYKMDIDLSDEDDIL